MEAAFLKAIAGCPADETTRLVYADWLQERSDPREAFVRAECNLAAVPVEAHARRMLLLAELLRLGRGWDRQWAQRVSRVPIPPVSCHLILTPDSSPHAAYPKADVELVNETDEPIVLELAGRGQFLFRFLNLLHRDPTGELVPSRYYGHAFTNSFRHTLYPIGPGERFRGTVALMANVERPPECAFPEDWGLAAGTYTGQAVFEYGGWVAASEPVPYEFRPRKKYVPEWGASSVRPRD